jgi:hemoglobin
MPAKAGPAFEANASMFARLGGREAITAAVEQFYQRVLADSELKPFFAATNMTWLKLRQTQFMVQALGGPQEYTGKSMKQAHAGRAIEPRHFQRVAGHLSETLAALKVPKSLIGEVMTAVASLEPDIVTQPTTDSPNTKKH